MHETNKKFRSVPAGVAECRITSLGHMECIKLKIKKFLVYQQGLQGVEMSCLRHMEGITLNKNFLVYHQGMQGAKFRLLGHMECIRLKQKIRYCTSTGCRVQNSVPWDIWNA